MKLLRKLLSISIFLITVFSFSSCSTTKEAENLINQGKIDKAIINMAGKLAKKSEDDKLAALLTEYYPSYTDGLDARLAQIEAKKGSDPFYNDKLVPLYAELLSIQKAIRPISGKTLGKKKVSVTVTADSRDLKGLLSDATEGAAKAHYDAAKKMNKISIDDKERAIDEYKIALEFIADYKDTKDQIAALYFDIAKEFGSKSTIDERSNSFEYIDFALTFKPKDKQIIHYAVSLAIKNADEVAADNTVEARANALKHLDIALKYDPDSTQIINRCIDYSYKNAVEVAKPGTFEARAEALPFIDTALSYKKDNPKIQILGASYAYKNAQTLSVFDDLDSLKNAITWYEKAQMYKPDYNGVATKLKETNYRVGLIYKDKKDRSSYDTSYTYFVKAGDYKNARQEVSLYNLDKALLTKSSDSKSKDGKYSLSTSGASSDSGVSTKIISNESPLRKRAVVTNQASELTIFSPKSDVVYIGSLIDGDSIASGEYRPISGSRAPAAISIDLGNIDGESSIIIENPAKGSDAQNMVRKLVSQGTTGDMAARVKFKSSEVRSSQQLSVSLGVGVNRGAVDFTNSTDFSTSFDRYRTIVELTQVYYTVNMDLPQKPADLFSTKGTLPNAEKMGTTPYYVSSVTYGRRAYFLIESSSNATEVANSLKVAVSGATTDTEATTDLNKKWEESKSSVTSYVLGGSSRGTITSLDGIMRWINSGMDISDNLGLAVPIGYTMRSVKDNGIALITNTEETVLPAQAEVTIKLNTITLTDPSDTPSDTFSKELLAHVLVSNRKSSTFPSKNQYFKELIRIKDGGRIKVEPSVPIQLGNSSAGATYTVAKPNDIIDIWFDAGVKFCRKGTLINYEDKLRWTNQEHITLTVEDIVNKTQTYQDLIRGHRFSGRGQEFMLSFDISIKEL